MGVECFQVLMAFSISWKISALFVLFSCSYLSVSNVFVTNFQEHHVPTGRGSVSVIIYGDQDKPALITYPDLALNRK